MDDIFIFVFFCIIAFSVITYPSKTSSSSNIQPVSNSSSQQKSAIQTSSQNDLSEHRCSYCGTTRCTKFQEDYEVAVKKYDAERRGLPPTLVLPGGKTVRELYEEQQLNKK